ncbi:MAG: MGMT family protein [Deltaproteobacteria bacterium]|nr:MGMT family protein [Deltaproteobacteria bacterium]
MHYTLFPTTIGTCGLGWMTQGIRCVQLPDVDASATERRLLRRAPTARRAAPPAWVRSAIRHMQAALAGTPAALSSLSAIPLDLGRVATFHAAAYRAARDIPAGRTLTYGELATRAGSPGAARAVGQALARNPVPLLIPCHRVIAASGRLGGFTAPGGLGLKRHLLALEGHRV